MNKKHFALSSPSSVRIDETVAGNVTTTYVGTSFPGGSEDKPIWQIKRIVETVDGSNSVTEIKFPDGDNRYFFAWTDRTSLNYL